MHKARSSTRDDLDKVKDALQKLKSENRKLRKENSQLRKELSRCEDPGLETQFDDDEAETQFVAVSEDSGKTPNCPKCRANAVMRVNVGVHIINLCSACGYKKRQEVRSKPE